MAVQSPASSVIKVYNESSQTIMLLACLLVVTQQVLEGMPLSRSSHQTVLPPLPENQTTRSRLSFCPSQGRKKAYHSYLCQQYIPVSESHLILSWSRNQNKVSGPASRRRAFTENKVILFELFRLPHHFNSSPMDYSFEEILD